MAKKATMKKLILFLILSSVYTSAFAHVGVINSFNAGELSPLLEGRTDIAKYYSGCRTLENMFCFSYGGTTRRPGTKYITTAKNSSVPCRLASFEYSQLQAYIIEFGHEYARFYKDGGQILDGAAAYEITTPYDGNDVFELQMIQSADTFYIVHSDYPPAKLTRSGHTDWSLTEIEFERGPFLDENSTDTTVTTEGYIITGVNITKDTFTIYSATDINTVFTDAKTFQVFGSTGNDGTWTVESVAYSSPNFIVTVTGNITNAVVDGDIVVVDGAVTLISSDDLWTADHVGAIWGINHIQESESIEGTFSAVGVSDTLVMQYGRSYVFSTHGTWTGTVILQRSFDGGSQWEDAYTTHYEGDGNITYPDDEIVDDAIYRVRMSDYTSGSLRYSLVAKSIKVTMVAKITAITDANEVTAIVKTAPGGITASKLWSEGAWSPSQGYPSAISFYEERLVLAGTEELPQTIWFSQTADWENFLIGSNDSDALIYEIASDQVDVIRWIVPQDWLLIGTNSAEWKIGSGSSDEALTPTKVSVRRQSSYGSDMIQPVTVDNVVLYVQRQGKKARELVFSYDQDAFVSPDLTVLSEHVTGQGITQIAFQKTPDPILWCCTSDGYIATMTYKRSQDVIGWSRQILDGDVESIAVIPGDGEDEVWISIEREINGSTVRYIEQFQPIDWGSDQSDMFFVDSGLSFDGGSAATITGITQAYPAVVTAASHGFSDGDQVRFESVAGMTELNCQVFTVDDATTNTFSLEDKTGAVDINSVDFTAYTLGGSVYQVENRFTTLSHLEGEDVQVLGDSAYAGTYEVSGGIITLDDYYNKVVAGLGYISKLKPMRLEVKANQGVANAVVRITELGVKFYKTVGAEYGPDFDNLTPFIFRDAEDRIDEAVPIYTGDKYGFFEGSYTRDSSICIEQNIPLPMSVIELIPDFEVRP